MSAPFDDIEDWEDELEDEDDLELEDFEVEDAMTAHARAAETDDDAVVYIRKLIAKDLPRPIIAQIEAAQDEAVDPDEVFYAVCGDQGRPIGLFDDRDMAFVEAREHNLTPVSVH